MLIFDVFDVTRVRRVRIFERTHTGLFRVNFFLTQGDLTRELVKFFLLLYDRVIQRR